MVLPDAIPQESVFFVEPWTQRLEEFVIRKMAQEYWEGSWIRGNRANNELVMEVVRLEVKAELSIDLPMGRYYEKLAQLERRYVNFSKLIAREDVVYDEDNNTVRASPETWWDIAETDPELLVYMRRGENCWFYMKELFVEYVEISDNTGGKAQARSQAASRSRSSGRRRQPRREVIEISTDNSGENLDFPRALYVSTDSSLPQSSESRCESGVVNQSSYSLGSPSNRGYPSGGSDSL